jgi:hypothetical protein
MVRVIPKTNTLVWVDLSGLGGWRNDDVREGAHGNLWIYEGVVDEGDTSHYRLHSLRSLATGYTEQFFGDEFREEIDHA